MQVNRGHGSHPRTRNLATSRYKVLHPVLHPILLVTMDAWILLSLLAGTIAVYYYFFKDLNLFKKYGILYLKPWPIVGNMGALFLRRKTIADVVETIYNLNRDAKYVGFFDGMNPILIIRDPELIKSIGVKNFDAFPDHHTFIDDSNDPLFGKNLFFLRGEKWRDVRATLSPVFTSSKMKNMFKLMVDCATNFVDFLCKSPSDKRTMEMNNYFSKYTNDVIASCAFGISVDSMKNPENDFYVYGKEITSFDIVRTIQFYLIRSIPRITRLLGIKLISNRVGLFFKDIIRITVVTRDRQNITRPDILQLLMDGRGKQGPGKAMTLHDITSQAIAFFFGGFDTVSTLMCFAAHEIAVNPEIQAKLRDEVDAVLRTTNGELTYEALNGMRYLDAVISETLRMWPVAAFLDRKCVQDFELPPALPGTKPFVMRKGMIVWFPAYGLHRDPKYFDDPNVFCPERFLIENKKNINPNVYIPFGIGPRMCIGNRFALMEIKIVLFYLLAHCELKPCEKTSYPLQLSKKVFTMMADGGFWLKVQPRKNKANISSSVANSSMANDHV